LVQRQEVTEEHLSSIFWVNILTGAILAALFFAGAPLLGRIYGEPALAPVMRVIAAMFVIYPIGMVHKAVLTRGLAFRKIAAVEISAAWIGGMTAIALAWMGVGVFSIALQFVVEFIVAAAALRLLCEWRPRFILRWSAVRDLSSFSRNVFFSNITGYWVRNIDNLLIGLYLGQYPLGLYSRAYAIMLFPISRVSWVFGRVLIRSFSIIQEDPARIRCILLKISRAIALLTFPMMLGVAASADAFVACVFGGQWVEMVPVLRILACVGMFQSVTSLTYSVYLARGRADLNLRVNLPFQLLQVAGILLGLKWGILGVAMGYAATALISAPIVCRFAGGLIGLSVTGFFSNLKAIFFCAAAMALAVAGLDLLLPPEVGAVARMSVFIVSGAAVYWSLLRGFNVPGYRELMDIVRERLPLLRGTA